MVPISLYGRQATAIASMFTMFSAVTVLLRLYTRLFLVRHMGAEDYFLILAMLSSCGWAISIGIRASYGMGQHYENLSVTDGEMYLKSLWIGLIFYNVSIGLTKMSILVQYLRVFKLPRFRIACWCILAALVTYTVWSILGNIFTCIPVRAFWAENVPGKCLNLYAMWFTNAGMNIAMDIIIIILPIPVVSKLQLPRRQKQALIVVFAVGGIASLITILRLYSLFTLIHSVDTTYYDAPASIWTSVELNIGIICSCLPVLRPLIAQFLPGFGSAVPKHSASVPLENQTVGSKRNGPIQSVYTIEAGDEDVENEAAISSRQHRNDQIKVTTMIDLQSDRSSYKSRREHNEDIDDAPRAAGSSTEVLVKDAGRIA